MRRADCFVPISLLLTAWLDSSGFLVAREQVAAPKLISASWENRAEPNNEQLTRQGSLGESTSVRVPFAGRAASPNMYNMYPLGAR